MLILWSKYLTFFEKLLFRNFPIFVLFEELVIQNQNLCSWRKFFGKLKENYLRRKPPFLPVGICWRERRQEPSSLPPPGHPPSPCSFSRSSWTEKSFEVYWAPKLCLESCLLQELVLPLHSFLCSSHPSLIFMKDAMLNGISVIADEFTDLYLTVGWAEIWCSDGCPFSHHWSPPASNGDWPETLLGKAATKQARKPRSYASPKLRLTDSLTYSQG